MKKIKILIYNKKKLYNTINLLSKWKYNTELYLLTDCLHHFTWSIFNIFENTSRITFNWRKKSTSSSNSRRHSCSTRYRTWITCSLKIKKRNKKFLKISNFIKPMNINIDIWQGNKLGQIFSFSQCIIQCENKNSWLSFTTLICGI